jgi:hypothetical protein
MSGDLRATMTVVTEIAEDERLKLIAKKFRGSITLQRKRWNRHP